MRRPTTAVAGAMLWLAACAPAGKQDHGANVPGNADLPAAPAPAPIAPPEPGAAGGLPDERTPLAEPNGPIDPKNVEAAGQVVQRYGALIEQRKFDEAEREWSDAAAAKQFSAGLLQYSEIHLQIGKPGNSEGAAGSIYVTVPVVVYGRASGGSFNRQAEVILRRVNDVDGSTAAQRRWHISNVEWTKAP
jgi:hypothetical protein